MAEYKIFHCPYGDDFEGGDECDRCEQYELCMETPNGDVIERSVYEKLRSDIDKAIDEIISLRKQYNNDDYYDCKYEILEILKRNGVYIEKR